jgi:hypothetical protein
VLSEYVNIEVEGDNLRCNIQYIGDENYLTLDSSRTSVIIWNSISKESKRVFISRAVINHFGSRDGYVFTCSDSIYHRYNIAKDELVAFPYSSIFSIDDEDFYSVDFNDNSSVVAIDSSRILTRIYSLKQDAQTAKFYEKPTLAVLNLQKNSYEVISISYPEEFLKNRYGALNKIFFGLGSNQFFSCDQISGKVVSISADYKEKKGYDLHDSRLIPASLDSISNTDMNIIFDHIEKSSYVQLFMFNNFNQRYYRVLKLDDSYSEAESDLGSKPYSVLQEFSKDFELLAEIVLPQEYNIYRITTNETGVLINVPSKNKNGYVYRNIKSSN